MGLSSVITAEVYLLEHPVPESPYHFQDSPMGLGRCLDEAGDRPRLLETAGGCCRCCCRCVKTVVVEVVWWMIASQLVALEGNLATPTHPLVWQ